MWLTAIDSRHHHQRIRHRAVAHATMRGALVGETDDELSLGVRRLLTVGSKSVERHEF